MSCVPGMTGAVSMAGTIEPVPLTTVTLFNKVASVDTESIALPVGHRAGDLALLYDWCYVGNSNGSDPVSVVPLGFTTFQSGVGGSGEIIDPPDKFGRNRVNISYRILDGLEIPGGSLIGMIGNRREAKILFLFRGNSRIKSVTPKSMTTMVNIGGFAEATIASGAGVTPIVVYGFTGRNITTQTFLVNSPAFSEIVSNGPSAGGYRVYNNTPANHQVRGHPGSGGTDSYGGNHCLGYLELA